MKKEIIIILLLLLVSFPAVRALLQPGGFTSHDLTHHVIRQISMDQLLSEGQFPPRWSGQLNNGYGYPLFLFNYPLPALVGEVFHKLGLGFVDAVKAVLLVSMLTSILGMYLFLKELLGSRLAAFLGACFYLYAPIRFLNVYVSAAVGSALALGILPLVFWAIVRRSILLGSISLAALILAHNVTALIFIPVIIIFSILCGRLRNLALIFLLGFGLSAWFWLPALLEKPYTRFDLIFGAFYRDQFPSLWQLIRSPWGYGLSHPQRPEPGDMSYQLGLIHIGVILIFLPILWVFRRIREIRVIGGFALAFFFLSVILMLKISLPVWENLPFLSLVQFPLRFSAVAIWSASIAAALLIKYLPFKKLFFITLLILVLYANRNHWHINQVFDPGESYYLNLKTTSTTYGEHLPKWGRIMDKGAPGKLEFVRGEKSPVDSSSGEIRVIKDKSAAVLAEVEAASTAQLRFNQFYFPGWQIRVDGELTSFSYLIDTESYGLPTFDIDKGKHQVSAEFKNSPIRNLADGISIITVIIVILSLWKLLPRN